MRLVEEAAKLALVQLRCTKSAAATCGSRHTKVGGCWCEAPGFGPSWGIVEVWAAARPCNGLYEFDTKPGERAATNTKLLSISAA